METELRSSGLAPSVFTRWAISLPSKSFLIFMQLVKSTPAALQRQRRDLEQNSVFPSPEGRPEASSNLDSEKKIT